MNYIIARLSFVLSNSKYTYCFAREDWERDGVLTNAAFHRVCSVLTATTGIQEPAVNFVDCLDCTYVVRALGIYRPEAPITFELCTDFEDAHQQGWITEAYEEDTSEELGDENH